MMEIVNAHAATLSNFEVMSHLQMIKDKRQNHKGQLATITYETLRHLENTPCKHQTETSIEQCIQELKPFNLSKTELLMIGNNPPTTPLEIQLIVEESEERLTEEQVQGLLDIVVKHFPFVKKTSTDEDKSSE